MAGTSTKDIGELLENGLSRSRDSWAYDKEIFSIPKQARELLEKYSGIPADQIEAHLYQVRDRAWDIHPYPCIGRFRFLALQMCTTPEYPEIIKRLQAGERLLDIGCCVGQELRRLVYDGAPAANLYGFDLRSSFFDIGYDVFRDREKFGATLLAGDAFEEPIPKPLAEHCQGKVSIVYAGSFFHLFGRQGQLYLAKMVGRLLKPEAGSMVIGRQLGSSEPGVIKTGRGAGMYRHNSETWREMWDEAGRGLGIEWDVTSRLEKRERPGDVSAELIVFCVRRK